MNNLDASSNGVVLEMWTSRDHDDAHHIASQCFTHIVGDTYIFTPNDDDDPDLTDLEHYNGVTKARIKGIMLETQSAKDLNEYAEFYLDAPYYKLNLAQCSGLLVGYMDEIYEERDILELYANHFKPKFTVEFLTGYSQGDAVEVVNFTDTTATTLHQLFFDSPVRAILEIESVEYPLTDYLTDYYTYDTKEILAGLEAELDHPKKAYILEWVKENLPVEIY